MASHETKYCTACRNAFECKAGSITLCHCYAVPLDAAERAYISERYADCLCNACLLEIKNQLIRMSEYEQRVKNAETRIFKVVFPNTTNHYDTLFGGTAMQFMDEVAFITATRFSRKRMVTVSTSKIDFKKPIPADTIVEVIGRVSKIGHTSLEIEVEIYKEEMYNTDNREKAIQGLFTFVALDENKQPTSVL
ncbi:Acyl-CoA hydrolase [Flexibacter flexilis DSM 6793]|uniref:Acyl-CoA hydrolase n=2 Tax=Flexibacter flexilis TaxID=998 RepID=A0A1I1MBV3_9BACT|nr:Acyl-CoA hydrolase [Flexibacter flexilis DSM 6793]